MNACRDIEYEVGSDCYESMLRMLRKLYPHYDENTQYVLWLSLDLFNKYTTHRIDARLQLKMETGEFLDVLDYLSSVGSDVGIANGSKKVLVRHPYPNNRLCQIGMKCGNKVIFGVPIVFDSLDELNKVKGARIMWTAHRPVCVQHNDEPFSMHLYDLLIDVDFNFLHREGCHFYTYSCRDYFEHDLQDMADDYDCQAIVKENDDQYMYKVGFSSYMLYVGDNSDYDWADEGLYASDLTWWGRQHGVDCSATSKEERKKSNDMLWGKLVYAFADNSFDYKALTESHRIIADLDDCIDYSRMYYYGCNQLRAKKSVDFMISSSFGFC